MNGNAGRESGSPTPTPRPEVSVLLPCYENEATLAGCLEALRRQTFRGFATVVVDSSPRDGCEAIVRGGFPEVRYEHSPHRLLPHAARNRCAELARGELLVFSDPDTYAEAAWLETLVATHRKTGHITVGALACHGRRWLDVGQHLCKFSKWLPHGPAREVDNAPTANLLVPRSLFEGLGRFDGERVLADTAFSWRARERGHALWFEPEAIVAHHHVNRPGAFLRERYTRGIEYGRMRAVRWRDRRALLAAYLLVSVLPVRLARILALTVQQCRWGRCLADLARTHPVVILGHVASLLGESRAYAARLVVRRRERGH